VSLASLANASGVLLKGPLSATAGGGFFMKEIVMMNRWLNHVGALVGLTPSSRGASALGLCSSRLVHGLCTLSMAGWVLGCAQQSQPDTASAAPASEVIEPPRASETPSEGVEEQPTSPEPSPAPTETGRRMPATSPSGEKWCGGFAEDTCSATEYCSYEAGQYCGAADASAVCKPRPQACAQMIAPVCGCDHKNYSSACHAALAGVGVLDQGECLD